MILEFSGVTKTFFDGDGVKDISFKLHAGEFVLLTGPSGSGKTTIMRLLTRDYDPDSGEILFEDTQVDSLKRRHIPHLRRRIGVIFQDYKLIPTLNVWENIALPLRIAQFTKSDIEQRVTDLLKLVDLPTKAQLFPIQLSGGEAQRVSIARALSLSPALIFADEPTGNLDPATTLHIASLLKKINSLGTTILFATHDTDILNSYNEARRIHLEKGSLTKDIPEKTKKKQADKSSKSNNDTAKETHE